MKLDIGGGLKPLPDHINMDPVTGLGPWKRKAQETPWPVFDNWFDEINASHVMEHIPAGSERIAVFNEAWRTLKPDGLFTVYVPMFGTWQAIADPTHISFWVAESFAYFDGRMHYDADYGIRPWATLSCKLRDGWEIKWQGKPVK